LRTIFSANRKHCYRAAYFARVQQIDDHYRYITHYSKDSRQDYEQQEATDVPRWCYRPGTTLYRVNVYPKVFPKGFPRNAD
jgi:hypothetical protein